MSDKRRVIVSDHALLRYLERGMKIDVEAARAAIEALCQRGADRDAQTVLHGGLRYVLRRQSEETVVVSTTLVKRDDYVHPPTRTIGGGHGS